MKIVSLFALAYLLVIGCAEPKHEYVCKTWCGSDVQHDALVSVQATNVTTAKDQCWEVGDPCPGSGLDALRSCTECAIKKGFCSAALVDCSAFASPGEGWCCDVGYTCSTTATSSVGGCVMKNPNCGNFTSCATCTPEIGCGWCGASGTCANDPQTCGGDWTWETTGCM